METVKLTKEEFIKRSMQGEVFEFHKGKYSYDSTKRVPFRVNDVNLDNSWDLFNGINEFTVVKPEPKTEEVFEWMYKNSSGDWHIAGNLYTRKQAHEHFNDTYGEQYRKTGRSFIVEID